MTTVEQRLRELEEKVSEISEMVPELRAYLAQADYNRRVAQARAKRWTTWQKYAAVFSGVIVGGIVFVESLLQILGVVK